MRTTGKTLRPRASRYSALLAALCLVGALPAVTADAQTVTATDTLEVMPTPVPLMGADGSLYLANFSVTINPTGPAPVFSAPVGAVNITAPPRDYLLSPLVGQSFPCGAGGTCVVITVTPSSSPVDDLGPFPVTLFAPLPDPGGGCTNVSGQVDGTWDYAFELPAGTVFTVMPSMGAPNPTPGMPPLPPVPMAVTFAPPMIVDPELPLVPEPVMNFEVCGDPENERTGTLAYQATLEGNDWSWNVAGSFQVTITDNGYGGGLHKASLTHTQTQSTVSGLLLSATDVPFPDIVDLAVERVEDDDAVANYELDPDLFDEPEAKAYTIQFTDVGPMNLQHLLTFAEPPNPVYTTGQENELRFPNVAAVALGQWMRRNGDPSLQLTAPVTGDTPDEWSVSVGPGAVNLQWSLE